MSNPLSSKEQRAIAHLTHCLTDHFSIPASDIQAEMVRGVVGFEGGQEVKRDHIQLTVSNPVVDEKGDALVSLPVQHRLADELAKVWSVGTRPLVTIDIPYPHRPVKRDGENVEVSGQQTAPEVSSGHIGTTEDDLTVDSEPPEAWQMP